ncbi:MAG: hypothetical protein WCX65_07775 [bacterium]
MNPIIIAAAAGVVILIAVFAVAAGGRRAKALNAFLSANGFAPCEDSKSDIGILAADLEQTDESSRFTIKNPATATHCDKEIYYYIKQREIKGDINESGPSEFGEFLFPFDRKSDLPVILYMVPLSAPEALIKKLIGPMVAVADRFDHKRIAKIALPRELQTSKIIAAYGPPGASIYDLISASEMSLILTAADRGAFVFLANKDTAAVDFFPGFAKIDINALWQQILQLADYR